MLKALKATQCTEGNKFGRKELRFSEKAVDFHSMCDNFVRDYGGETGETLRRKLRFS